MKEIRLGDYIDVLTDYHSGGSYKTLKEKTKILYEPNYAVMIRTLNFENDEFYKDLIYCDEASYNFLEYSHVKENDILMNKIANPGSVYIMPKVDYRVTCAMNLFLLRFKNINQRYIYYVMKNAEQYIKSKAHGTTTKTITKEEVRNLKFMIHEKEEEREKIADFFTNIDLKLENNKKIIKELENYGSTIYSYWFEQFDFDDEKNNPYKTSDGQMEYNQDIKKEIPKGWKYIPLKTITNQINGFAFSSDFYTEDGIYKLYTIKNVQDGCIISKVDNYLNELPIKMDKECLLKPKDIILSLTGNVGRTGLVFENNALLNQRVLKIKENGVSKEFIYFLLRNDTMKKRMEKIATGTSQKNLSPIQLGELKIIVPDEKVIERFNKKVNGIIDLIVKKYSENEELIKLKEKMLPLVMNGQIKF